MLAGKLGVLIARIFFELLDVITDSLGWFFVMSSTDVGLSRFKAPYAAAMVLAIGVSLWCLKHRVSMARKLLSKVTVRPDDAADEGGVFDDSMREIRALPLDVVSELSGLNVADAAEMLRTKEPIALDALKDSLEIEGRLEIIDEVVKDCEVTIVVGLMEDFPMLAINLCVLANASVVCGEVRLDWAIQMTTLFNTLMLGAKLPKIVELRKLFKRRAELKKRKERRKSSIFSRASVSNSSA